MVALKGHGGNCCGARHLHSFGSTEERNPDLISTALASVDDQRMTEVILNGNQVRDYPTILQRLADLGFVLVGHYINGNHNSHNYVFHRCDNRQPLLDARGRCVINWNGPIITPRLEGRLPSARTTLRNMVGNINDPRYVRPALIKGATRHGFRVLDRVRINSPQSRRHNQILTIREVGFENCYFTDDRGVRFGIIHQNCVHVDENGRDRIAPTVHAGRRVVMNSSTAYMWARGALATITAVHQGGRYVMIEFDNPVRQHTSWIDLINMTILTDEEAAANPRVRHEPERQEHPVTRHAEAPDWQAVLAAAGRVAEVANVPVTRLFSTFHNVYQGGRRGAGYDDLESARAARRDRQGRIDRKDMMSDGTVQWADDINVQAA